jgi:2,3-bisphosphoglycerate-dependent phosphoglycerate mutase
MAQKNLYLIRHGKASMEGTDRERILDNDGTIQATSLCKKIKNQFENQKIRIISSPFRRAMQTIEKLSLDMNIDIEQSDALEEIKIGKDENLSKHQIIEKMWSDQNFKVKSGSSQSEHVKMIKQNIEKILEDFYQKDYNLILVSHGNSIGIILKYFLNTSFTFNDWKKISMPDMYCLGFDEKNKVINFKRDIEGIEKIFTI